LVGEAADGSNEPVYLAFVTSPPADLPHELIDLTVHRIDAERFRLSSANGEWLLSATGAHLHRDVTKVFYRAVPPRPAPLGKRVFWRIVLTLAATPIGRALLARRG
jgi:hypothetical protein